MPPLATILRFHVQHKTLPLCFFNVYNGLCERKSQNLRVPSYEHDINNGIPSDDTDISLIGNGCERNVFLEKLFSRNLSVRGSQLHILLFLCDDNKMFSFSQKRKQLIPELVNHENISTPLRKSHNLIV